MMQNEITKDQWADWRDHPVTKAFIEAIKIRREEHIHALELFSESQHKLTVMIGRISGLTEVLDTSFEEGDK